MQFQVVNTCEFDCFFTDCVCMT